jgi:hypothetical protein
MEKFQLENNTSPVQPPSSHLPRKERKEELETGDRNSRVATNKKAKPAFARRGSSVGSIFVGASPSESIKI